MTRRDRPPRDRCDTRPAAGVRSIRPSTQVRRQICGGDTLGIPDGLRVPGGGETSSSSNHPNASFVLTPKGGMTSVTHWAEDRPGERADRRDPGRAPFRPRRKNGTSAPMLAAIARVALSGSAVPHRQLNPRIAAAASLLPPPSPDCSGMRLTIRTVTSRGSPRRPAARHIIAAARHTRFVRSVGHAGSSHSIRNGPRVRTKRQRIVHRERLKHGPQPVIAVGPHAGHAQGEIDLCAGLHRHGCRRSALLATSGARERTGLPQFFQRDRLGPRRNLDREHVSAERQIELDLRQTEPQSRSASRRGSSAARSSASRRPEDPVESPDTQRATLARPRPMLGGDDAPRCGASVAVKIELARSHRARCASPRPPASLRSGAARPRSPSARVRRSVASIGTPATASSTSSARPCSSTRRSRGSSSVASSLRATKMKTGCPNGASGLEPRRRGRGQTGQEAGAEAAAADRPADGYFRGDGRDVATGVGGLAQRVGCIHGRGARTDGELHQRRRTEPQTAPSGARTLAPPESAPQNTRRLRRNAYVGSASGGPARSG